jgi:hypothetical protein
VLKRRRLRFRWFIDGRRRFWLGRYRELGIRGLGIASPNEPAAEALVHVIDLTDSKSPRMSEDVRQNTNPH